MAVPEKPKAAEIIQKIISFTKRTILLGLYPRHCPFCSKLLPSTQLLCSDCEKKLPLIHQPCCYRCGKTISDQSQELCYDCRSFPKSFRRGLSLFYYNEKTRPLIADFKYHNNRLLADYLSYEIARQHLDTLISWDLDYIVPIPVHKNKRKKRGYNQTELLAKALSKETGIPVLKDLLLRTIDTPPQKQFSPRVRYQNLAAAFQYNDTYDASQIRNVLLLDDIYTTGATMEACTKALLLAGVQEVNIYSVCIGMARD